MPIRFLCPACRVTIKANDDKGGVRFRCPSCGAMAEVPIPKGELTEPPVSLPPPSPIQAAPPQPAAFDFDGPQQEDWPEDLAPRMQIVRATTGRGAYRRGDSPSDFNRALQWGCGIYLGMALGGLVLFFVTVFFCFGGSAMLGGLLKDRPGIRSK